MDNINSIADSSYSNLQLPKDELHEVVVESHAKSLANPNHPDRDEDNFINSAKHKIFAVFDGMGGYRGGERASRESSIQIFNSLEKLDDNLSGDEIIDGIIKSINSLNKNLIELQQSNPELSKMGTTASIVKVTDRQDGKYAVICNVGDSRVWLHRRSSGRELFLLTDDDGYVMQHYGNNLPEARKIQETLDNFDKIPPINSPYYEFYRNRNKIFNPVGRFNMDPRIYVYKLEKGDEIYITSDGVHDNLTRKEMSGIVGHFRSVTESVDNLVLYASRTRRKKDDITAVGFKV